MSLHTQTIHQLRDRLRRGDVSAREVTQAVLNRIQAVDDKLKAYLWLNADDALAQADAIDRSGAAKNGKPLGGVPIAIKDVDRKSTRLNSSHERLSRMPSSA